MAWSRTLLAHSLVGRTFAPCLGEDLLATNFCFVLLAYFVSISRNVARGRAHARLIDDVICVLSKTQSCTVSSMHCAYNGKVVLQWMSFIWKISYHLLGGGGGGGGIS